MNEQRLGKSWKKDRSSLAYRFSDFPDRAGVGFRLFYFPDALFWRHLYASNKKPANAGYQGKP